MKQLASILVIFLFAFNTHAQADARATWLSSTLNDSELSSVEQKTRVIKYNFGPLWSRTDNSAVFGFIGDNCQCLRIKILSAAKQPGRPDTYTVTGKSMVKNVVRRFDGTMKLTNARVLKNARLGVDEEYRSQRIKEHGVVIGEYHFSEDRKETNTGSFDGVFATYCYVDRNGRLKYDDLMMHADGYSNNQLEHGLRTKTEPVKSRIGATIGSRSRGNSIWEWGNFLRTINILRTAGNPIETHILETISGPGLKKKGNGGDKLSGPTLSR